RQRIGRRNRGQQGDADRSDRHERGVDDPGTERGLREQKVEVLERGWQVKPQRKFHAVEIALVLERRDRHPRHGKERKDHERDQPRVDPGVAEEAPSPGHHRGVRRRHPRPPRSPSTRATSAPDSEMTMMMHATTIASSNLRWAMKSSCRIDSGRLALVASSAMLPMLRAAPTNVIMPTATRVGAISLSTMRR